VSIAANDANEVFVAQAVLFNASNYVVVKIAPKRQIVIKAGGSEVIVSNVRRSAILCGAGYMLSTGRFVTVA
jgi:hypothetical protein